MEHLRSLRPTPEQYREFAVFLSRAHSWYKHLPLITGARFVVFVAPDSGIGRLIPVIHGAEVSLIPAPEGPEFTDEHPRLHYGWKTTIEYRTRFGYLDYMRSYGSDDAYSRDFGSPIPLPDRLEARCAFTLYPYVSENFAEAVTYPVHKRAIDQLRSGIAHPAKDEVLDLARLAAPQYTAWRGLPDSERLWAVSRRHDRPKPIPVDASDELLRYLEADDKINEICRLLGARELAKITNALQELDHWLQDES